jgi:hypothetical protein
MNFEEIKLYLPKFLSAEAERELLHEMRNFISGTLKNRYYSSFLEKNPIIYQGDGFFNLPLYDYDENKIKHTKSVVLSNTCDVDMENPRKFPIFITHCPLINLSKYKAHLERSSITNEQIESHITSIKNQEVTQMFYLPKNQILEDDSIALLDRSFSSPNNLIDRNNLQSNRIFSLSDFGAYLFILKLSIHFTRIQDKVERGATH